MGLTTLEHLCGSHIFSGVEMTTEKHHSLYQGEETDRDVCLFTFDGITYKATEDPDDGYRSYCNGRPSAYVSIPRSTSRLSYDGRQF